MNNFKEYLRLTWRENWKTLAGLPVAVFAVCLVCELAQCGKNEAYAQFALYINPIDTDVFFFIALLALTIYASLMFGNLNSKEGRLTTLTLPVSAPAMFWRGIITYVAYPIVAVCVAMLLADVCRAAIMTMVGWELYAHITPVRNIFFCYTGEAWRLGVGLWLALLNCQAFFACGSIFFPRHSYLKTLLLGMGYNAVLLFCMGFITAMRFERKFDMYPASWFTQDVLFWTIIGGMAFLTLALYAISYVRLKDAEVQNRW